MNDTPDPPGTTWGDLARNWQPLALACLGWLFDTMDQRLFVLTRTPALRQLLPTGSDVESAAAAATAIFVAGWATGGLAFGLLGDRAGRARTMTLTVLVYSLCTGLSAFAVGWWDFAAYRFLTGLGVGGEFAAGAALVAETFPDRSRALALGTLQATAVVGTFAGTLLGMLVPPRSELWGLAGWRWLFLAGALPALLAVYLRTGLAEPAAWRAARAAGRLGDAAELVGDPRWRSRAWRGVLLGAAGIVGVWAAGLWVPELVADARREAHRHASGLPATPGGRETFEQLAVRAGDPGRAAEWKREADALTSRALLLKDAGSILGVMACAALAARWGRRPAFALFFVLGAVSVVVAYTSVRGPDELWWAMPLLGFGAWGPLGGYAVYFPELFPARLRSTGVGLCYNAARYLTAFGLAGLSGLVTLYGSLGWEVPLRPAAVTVATVYLVGLVVLPFLPETRGRPLPE
jgi:MFS family permease